MFYDSIDSIDPQDGKLLVIPTLLIRCKTGADNTTNNSPFLCVILYEDLKIK